MTKDKRLLKEFKKELQEITNFITNVDPTVQVVHTSALNLIKTTLAKWSNINLKDSNKQKNITELLNSISNLKSYFESDLYFFQKENYLQIKKDETRENYNLATKEINKFRQLYLQFYFVLFLSDKLQEIEIQICKAIYNAIKKRERDPKRLKDTSEEHFRDDIFDIVQGAINNTIYISKETPMGYAKEKIGETDLFFSTEMEGLYKPIAIGEVKEWGNFKNKQIGQLLGYMNHSTHFGFTIIINKDTNLNSVEKSVVNTLKDLKKLPDNNILKVWKSGRELTMENTFISIHKNPETQSEFKIYHFIANCYSPERKDLASKVRR